MPETNTLPAHPEQRTQRRKRTAVVALLLLIGGAIVNVAVAWGLALRPEPVPTSTRYQHHMVFTHAQRSPVLLIDPPQPINLGMARGSREFSLEDWRDDFNYSISFEVARMGMQCSLGECRTVLSDGRRQFPATSRYIPPQDCRETDFFRYLPKESVLHDPDVFASIVQQDERSRKVAELFTGWPMYAFRGVTHFRCPNLDPLQAYQWQRIGSQGVVQVRLNRMLRTDLREDVPVHPLPRGFIVNTLFYALLIWLVFFAPFAARRVLRRKRRLCEKCAYPVGVSPVCTECGVGVIRRD